jgi:hypothetical protein
MITTQYPSDQMKAYPVNAMVNSPRHNDPSLLNPIKVSQKVRLLFCLPLLVCEELSKFHSY